jgi:hypothetical protein
MARICNDRVRWSCVDTRAYSPTRNIFAGARRWPKTLFVIAVVEARLTAISECPMRRALS